MATTSVQAERLRGLFLAMVAALLLLAAMCATVATDEALPWANAQPLAGTDALGFVNSPVRCDPQQTPVVVVNQKWKPTLPGPASAGVGIVSLGAAGRFLVIAASSTTGAS